MAAAISFMRLSPSGCDTIHWLNIAPYAIATPAQTSANTSSTAIVPPVMFLTTCFFTHSLVLVLHCYKTKRLSFEGQALEYETQILNSPGSFFATEVFFRRT